MRTINLRRTPVLLAHDTPFVSEHVPLAEIDRHWAHLCQENPAYFDGRLWHVIGVHRNGHGGASVHVQPAAYRNWAVQHSFNLAVGVRPLGVKGLVLRDGCVLLSKRSDCVAAYAGLWEFAPGGGVEPDHTPAHAITRELQEETTLSTSREPVAIAMILDDAINTWEIIYRIDGPTGQVMATSEYTEHRWLSGAALDDLPANITAISRQMRPLARAALGR